MTSTGTATHRRSVSPEDRADRGFAGSDSACGYRVGAGPWGCARKRHYTYRSQQRFTTRYRNLLIQVSW